MELRELARARRRDSSTRSSGAVVGKREQLELVLLGMLADGHVLLEDVPGLAKTLAGAVVRARRAASTSAASSSRRTCCPPT